MDDVARFCRDVYPRLARGLGAQCGDRWTGEELAQEALARAWERWPRIRGYDSPEAWVWRVGLNLSTSRLRRQQAERRALERAPQGAAVIEHHIAEDVALRSALAGLPPRQRAAVVLRYIGDLSVFEAAEAMRCAPGTVKALCNQGLTRLRDVLSTAAHEELANDA